MDSYLAVPTLAYRLNALAGTMLAAGFALAGTMPAAHLALGAAGVGITALAPIGSALAQEQKAGGNTVRPEIGKFLDRLAAADTE